MLLSKLLGGKILTPQRTSRDKAIASHASPRSLQPLTFTRIGVPSRKGPYLGARFSNIVVKSPPRPRRNKGLKKARGLEKKVDSLLRSGIHYHNPRIMRLFMPGSVIGKKRKMEEAGLEVCRLRDKRARITSVLPLTTRDSTWRFKNRGRLQTVERRTQRRRACLTGQKSFFVESIVPRDCTLVYPFPTIPQTLGFQSATENTSAESAASSNIMRAEDIMDSEDTVTTSLLTQESSVSDSNVLPQSILSQYPQSMEIDDENAESPVINQEEHADLSDDSPMTDVKTTEVTHTHSHSPPSPLSSLSSNSSRSTSPSPSPRSKKRNRVIPFLMLGDGLLMDMTDAKPSTHLRVQEELPSTPQVSAELTEQPPKQERPESPESEVQAPIVSSPAPSTDVDASQPTPFPLSLSTSPEPSPPATPITPDKIKTTPVSTGTKTIGEMMERPQDITSTPQVEEARVKDQPSVELSPAEAEAYIDDILVILGLESAMNNTTIKPPPDCRPYWLRDIHRREAEKAAQKAAEKAAQKD